MSQAVNRELRVSQAEFTIHGLTPLSTRRVRLCAAVAQLSRLVVLTFP